MSVQIIVLYALTVAVFVLALRTVRRQDTRSTIFWFVGLCVGYPLASMALFLTIFFAPGASPDTLVNSVGPAIFSEALVLLLALVCLVCRACGLQLLGTTESPWQVDFFAALALATLVFFLAFAAKAHLILKMKGVT